MMRVNERDDWLIPAYRTVQPGMPSSGGIAAFGASESA